MRCYKLRSEEALKEMDIIQNQLLKNLETYGSFAQPLLHLLLKERIPPSLRHYLRAMKLIWQRKKPQALKEVEKGLKMRPSKTLRYMLLAEKLSLLQHLGKPGAEELYLKLRKDFHHVPQRSRLVLASTLLNFQALSKEKYLPPSRFWSKIYQEDPSSQVFILLGKARKLVKEGHLKEARDFFLQSIEMAKKIPHPTGLINGLNDLAWYSKESNPHLAWKWAKESIYWLGFYFDDLNRWIAPLDTFFHIQRKVGDPLLWESARLIQGCSLYRENQKKYASLFKKCHLLLSLEKMSLFQNSPQLRRFLKRSIEHQKEISKTTGISEAELSLILSGKRKWIRKETLIKLMRTPKPQLDGKDWPPSLSCYWQGINREEHFLKALETLAKMKKEEKMLQILALYSSYPCRKRFLPELAGEKGLLDLLKLAKENPDDLRDSKEEIICFLSGFSHLHPFLEARRDQALAFLKELPSGIRRNFLNLYFSLKEEDREQLDLFMRNYSRYKKLRMRVRVSGDLKDVVRSLRLSGSAFFLALWAFEKEEKRKRVEQFMRLLVSTAWTAPL